MVHRMLQSDGADLVTTMQRCVASTPGSDYVQLTCCQAAHASRVRGELPPPSAAVPPRRRATCSSFAVRCCPGARTWRADAWQNKGPDRTWRYQAVPGNQLRGARMSMPVAESMVCLMFCRFGSQLPGRARRARC